MRKARMDCKPPKRISDRLAKSLLEACKRYYFSPENAKGFEEWKKQKDEEDRKKKKRYLSESEAQSPKKTASERESKSLPEAVFYSDFFTYGHGLWSNMWSKVFESVLRAVVQPKINPFTVRYTQKQNYILTERYIKIRTENQGYILANKFSFEFG